MEEPEKKPEEEPEKKPEVDSPQAPQEPQAPDPFEGINARLASMEQAQSDMMKAISALANQGAVNASVSADNGDDGDGTDDYPVIDLDSMNRLIGD